MKTVIILGSSRKDGETAKIVKELSHLAGWDVIDLNDYQFSYYDYEHKNRNDDFLPLIKNLIEKYDVLVFATPVYWYSMSGIMKVFFDRLSDLLTIEKETGRKLRGKKMAVISSSAGGNLGEHFWLPFTESANYLGMSYITNMHTYEGENATVNLKKFVAEIQQNS